MLDTSGSHFAGEMPFFTIAIANYNRADMIRQCIESCLQQAFGSFEVLVVDGASSDGSVGVINAFNDCRLRLFIQPKNLGISSGRYEAVARARGSWILQVDSDHLLEPRALAVLKNAIDKVGDASVGAVWARYRWNTGLVTPKFVPIGIIGYVERMRWVEEEGGRDGVFCARRDALFETNWFCDRRASMDTLFHLNFSRRWKQLYLEEIVALQYATIGNSSSRGHVGRSRMLRKWASDMAWQYDEIHRTHGSVLAVHGPRTLLEIVRQSVLQHFYAGNRGAALKSGWRYLRMAPGDLGVWLVLMIGVITPQSVSKLNQWRHAIRNYTGV